MPSAEQIIQEEIRKRDEDVAAKQALLHQQLQDEQAKQTPFIDLSPTAGFIDSAFGTKIAPAIQQQAVLHKEDDKQLNDLNKQLVDLKRPEITGLAAALGTSNKPDHFYDRQNQTGFKYVMDMYGKEQKAVNDIDTQFSNIDAALQSRNVERVRAALAPFARAVSGEKGVLTDADLGRTLIPTLDSTYVAAMARLGDKTGQLPESDLVNMRASIKEAKKNVGSIAAKTAASQRVSFENDSPFTEAFHKAEPGLVRSYEKTIQGWALPDPEEKKLLKQVAKTGVLPEQPADPSLARLQELRAKKAAQ